LGGAIRKPQPGIFAKDDPGGDADPRVTTVGIILKIDVLVFQDLPSRSMNTLSIQWPPPVHGDFDSGRDTRLFSCVGLTKITTVEISSRLGKYSRSFAWPGSAFRHSCFGPGAHGLEVEHAAPH